MEQGEREEGVCGRGQGASRGGSPQHHSPRGFRHHENQRASIGFGIRHVSGRRENHFLQSRGQSEGALH